MARGIRFTKAERDEVRAGLEWRAKLTVNRPGRGPEPTANSKVAERALAKLLASEAPAGTGVPARQAVEAFRDVLGQRLVAPLSSAQGVWAQMQNRLNALGLSRMDCVSAAKAAAAEWRGPIKAESIVRQADRLLQAAQLEIPGARGASPVEMEDL